MITLHLAVKRTYFEQAQDGLKPFEYRLRNEYWTKRLVGRHYDDICYTLGYPHSDDVERIMRMPYRGYEIQTITHELFGPNPVEVFAIRIDVEKITKRGEVDD